VNLGNPVGQDAGDGSGAAGYLEPFVDIFQVGTHGSLGYAEAAGDLGVGVPGGQQVQQIFLPGVSRGTG
jgi:hypothetical protein